MPGFDRRRHRIAEPRSFEDPRVGGRFPIPSRTVTEGHFVAFQTVSADNHHYDIEYCRERGLPAPPRFCASPPRARAASGI
jgi:acyl dehydratase